MNHAQFQVICKVCQKEVNDFTQSIKFILVENGAQEVSQTMYLSCGCVVDFFDMDIDLNTGKCEVRDFAGKLYLEFYDEELIMEGDEDEGP
jgi:hypothetical protein